ncbi:MAG TPA: hypothetical protein VGA96_07880 [Fibrella sp.]
MKKTASLIVITIPDINTMREGLDRSEIDEVAAMANLTKKEMATLLGKSERNRYYQTQKPLSLLESEHLVNLKVLFSQGLTIFDGNVNAFSDWLRTPKQALAVSETGFPIVVPENYKKPSLTGLFALHTEEENTLAIERNMAFNRQLAAEQTKPFPTPLSILDSPTGLRLVGDILGRIDAGVYS